MIYLDASLVVALLVPEAHSDRAEAWFGGQPAGALFVSGWTVTEVSSALSFKLRMGTLTLDRRAAALNGWHALREASLLTLAIADEHFEQASRITDQHDLGMRAGDALQLAIARDACGRLATFDKRMTNAALPLGMVVEPI